MSKNFHFVRSSKLNKADPAKRKGIILYNRATTKRLLGLETEARSDIENAYRNDMDDPNIVGAYAIQRERDSGLDEAIRVLEQYRGTTEHPALSFILSNMLYQRSGENDLNHALSLLTHWCKEISKVAPDYGRYDFLRLISEVLLKLDRKREAVMLINETPESAIPSTYKQLLLLWIEIETKTIDSNRAKQLCEKAAKNISGQDSYFVIREVALFSDKIKHYPLSFVLWKEITSSKDFNTDTHHLLHAAKNVKEYNYIIDFCKQLRKNGIHERSAYICEIDANMEGHEFNEAINLMTEWLSHCPHDKEMRMNLSLFAFEIGKDQYIENNPENLPSIEDVNNADYGNKVVMALERAYNTEAALIFAYALWRKFPDEMASRRTLITASINAENNTTLLAKPDTVERDCAITYKSIDTGQIQTHIIETGLAPSLTRNEYPPNHDISILLLNKKEGESVIINEREWKIVEINNKYIYTKSILLRDFCIQFPKNQFLQEFHVPKEISPAMDLQEALKEIGPFLQKIELKQKAMEDLYHKAMLPVVKFAQCMGKSVLETMMYFAASSNHKVLVCTGGSNEHQVAYSNLTRECEIVLDETAVATLFMLGLHKELQQLPYNIIVPQALLYEIRRIINQATINKRSILYLGIMNGKINVNKVSPTEHANWIRSLEELLISLQENCIIEGGRALLEINPSIKEQLIQGLGPVNADAIAISKKRDAIYWTDDLLIGNVAKELKVKRIWSQIALQHVKDTEKQFTKAYRNAIKNLFMWGYDFTAVHIQTIIDIYKEAGWKAKDQRIKYAEEFIVRVGTINNYNCVLTCVLIIRIWRECQNRKKACKLIVNILEKIGRERSGPLIAKPIYRGLYPIKYNRKIKSLKHMLRTWRMNSLKLE